jgi:uncharacterized integral membrane protein
MNDQLPTPEKRSPTTIAKWILLGLVVIYLVALVADNREEVEVSFVFFHATVSLVVALVLAGVLGAFLGWGFTAMRRRHKRRTR